jgi:hypothetical protein
MSCGPLKDIEIPGEFNYIAVFLTFSCTLRCSYCINHHGGDLVKKRWMSGEDWVRAINRIRPRQDLPVTLQGGEPTLHKHFYQIIRGINPQHPIDLLTNLELDIDEFMRQVPPQRIKRDSPYASIRVSYHKDQQDPDTLLKQVKNLQDHGYSVGIWGLNHPGFIDHTRQIRRQALDMGLDFRLKEFLGPYKGVNYGTMRYPDAVNARRLSSCECKTTELLIDPEGSVFRCHSDLYADRSPIGHLLDAHPPRLLGQWVPCTMFGKCNSCDIKIKNNRFQEFGHSSVEIRNISPPYADNNEHVEEIVNTYGKLDGLFPHNHP